MNATSQNTLNIMVVDDTRLFRSILEKVLNGIRGVRVVATAENGNDALKQLQQVQPDVVFLDVEMPSMNGIQTLRVIKSKFPCMTCIMVSGHNQANASITIEALNSGAFDFVPKPNSANASESEAQLQAQLKTILGGLLWQRAYTRVGQKQRQRQVAPQKSVAKNSPTAGPAEHSASILEAPLEAMTLHHETPAPQNKLKASKKELAPDVKTAKKASHASKTPAPVTAESRTEATPPERGIKRGTQPTLRQIEAVLIGVSTGGPACLTQLFSQVQANLRVPILVVQHMPALFTKSLAESLNQNCPLPVKEAEAGEALLPGHVYIAPGGRHLEVARNRDGKGLYLSVSDGPAYNACKPSVDVLFKSAAAVFRGGLMSLILTGMGRDGLEGVQALKGRVPTLCYTQSEESCTVYGMPKAIDDQHLSDGQLDVAALAAKVNQLK